MAARAPLRAQPFLREIGVVKAGQPGALGGESTRHADAGHGRRRRRPVVRSPEGVASPACLDRRPFPRYVIFHDSTLAEIAERRPSDWADLAAVPGIGPAKLDRYADEVRHRLGRLVGIRRVEP